MAGLVSPPSHRGLAARAVAPGTTGLLAMIDVVSLARPRQNTVDRLK
jgi:hypothetical protein